MSRVTKPATERYQEIVKTARKLFVEKGYEETQISDIAHELGIAHGLIYHYFKSKIEILYAVIDELAKTHLQEAEKMISNYDGTTLECIDALLAEGAKDSCYEKLMTSLMADQAVVEYLKRTVTVSTAPIMLSLIERGNADGSWHCEYPRETTEFIIHGMSGIMSASGPEIKTDESRKQIFTSIVMRLLGMK